LVIVANNATALVERMAGWWPWRIAAPGNVVVTPEPATAVASTAGPVVGRLDVVEVTDRALIEVIRGGEAIEVREA
jgi:hypothetical protein